MSFVDQDDVMAVTENMVKKIWQEIKGVALEPIPAMTYKEAMKPVFGRSARTFTAPQRHCPVRFVIVVPDWCRASEPARR